MTTSTATPTRHRAKHKMKASQRISTETTEAMVPAYGDTIYVYLDSGQVAVVRSVTSMEMSDRTIRLLRDGRTIAEYRRNDVFCASRELISPPFSC